MHLADFNNDGRLDLLSSGTLGNGVWLSLGTGRGIARAGHDAAADLLLGAVRHRRLQCRWLPRCRGDRGQRHRGAAFLPAGSADGLRGPAYTRPVVLSVQDVGAADTNEDGALDLVVVAGSTLGVYLNDGIGQFVAGAKRTINPICFELAVGDFTGDGHADVLCSSYQGTNVSLVPGTGTGGLGALQNVAVLSRTYHVNFGNMDGDGDLDLLINIDRGIVQVLLNDGRGQFGPRHGRADWPGAVQRGGRGGPERGWGAGCLHRQRHVEPRDAAWY
ncbi:MAG: VCBS repeat-containing protein [Hymenobacter sp.]